MAENPQPQPSTTAETNQQTQQPSNPSKKVPWYNPQPPKIPRSIATLLSTYSLIPPPQQITHIISIRDKAYAIHPYPCLGLYAFLRLHLQTSPLFPAIVEHLHTESGALFLDLGTGLGQEVRGIIAAGAPAQRVRGVELEPAFHELGFELFRDAERLGNGNGNGSGSGSSSEVMLVGDILLDSGAGSLDGLYGKVSVLHAASFLHLWDWDGQVDVAGRMVRLMQDRIGVRMLGRQIGSVRAGAKVHETNKNGQTMWKHDPASFAALWAEVGLGTGTEWRVTAELGKPYVKMDERTGLWWHDPDTRTIIWSLVRVG